jgi:anti-sigma-K factor RskA
LAQIGATAQARPTADGGVIDLAARRFGRTRQRGPVLAIVAAAAMVVVGFLGLGILRDDRDPVADLVAAPDAVTTVLDGPAGSLRVVWSDQLDRAAILGTGLAPPGADKTYELWSVTDNGVEPAGLFVPDNGEVRVVLDVGDIAGAGWGVTIEPAGGSPQPTTDVLYLGLTA